MPSNQDFLNFLLDQLGNRSDITSRKMFGEYALYCKNKVVALICDNQLYIKPTDAGRKFIGTVTEAPPYPGARNYYLMADRIEDGEWLDELIRITCSELPAPKPNPAKRRKHSNTTTQKDALGISRCTSNYLHRKCS